MCRYIITRGKDKGQNCQVAGKDKYNGYCKRHYDRHIKKDNKPKMSKRNDNVIKREVPIVKGNITIANNQKRQPKLKETYGQPYEETDEMTYDPFPEIIEKYNPTLEDCEIEPEYSDLYYQYQDVCELKDEEPIDYNEFDEDEYLKHVGEELDSIHAPKFDEQFIKDSLFNLNLVAFSALEQGSEIMKEQYPEKDLTDLKGLTRDVYDEQELYKQALYDIYREHYEVIDEYISPITTYILLSVKSIGIRYTKNKKKESY